MSEANLIVAGGSAAFEKLLEAALRPFVARRVAPTDVDDVVQNVLLRMQRGLRDLRQDERIGPWMYQIARRAIADHFRAAARNAIANDETRAEATATSDDDDGAAERALAGCVATFIAALPSPYREALTLTELEGFAQKKAAEMIGVSPSGMRSRVQRGRDRLRKVMEKCCEIGLDARGRVISCEPRQRR